MSKLNSSSPCLTILVTGGAGFIGVNLVRYLLQHTENQVVNIDKLTYAGHMASLKDISSDRHHFVHGDICDLQRLEQLFDQYRPDIVMHLAAESHVDRSIDGPMAFIDTNVAGTATLLQAALGYWSSLPDDNKSSFRFHHVSTDEVFGDLQIDEPAFTEQNQYAPSSPYSASKAASDHLVRAWGRTYGLPVLISNCSNNYGPYQLPEKLIPLTIMNALEGKSLPIFGDGQQIRDWLFVDDHVKALWLVASSGMVGETYNVGGSNEITNLQVVSKICDVLDGLKPNRPKNIGQYSDLIEFVKDRPGHDRRYAIDHAKISKQLGWYPAQSFDSGIVRTVEWYIQNLEWCKQVQHTETRQRKGQIND